MEKFWNIFDGATGDWRQRLNFVVEMMRDMSRQTEPQAMVRNYVTHLRKVLPVDRSISLSRRGLPAPRFRVTRNTLWKEDVNPWRQPERLPILEGGLLAELIYSDEPRIIDDLRVSIDDPAAEFFAGERSLMAIPLYEQGVAINMVVLMRTEPAAFHHEELAWQVWMGNLFGRATSNLVLSDQLQDAYAQTDRELQTIAQLQRSLLPRELPTVPTLDLAAHYQTSRVAGGDYYDFFHLPNNQLGILLADVSGHGTPAAVLMAVMHAIVHSYPSPPLSPGELLRYANAHLCKRYTSDKGLFITAFYGVYDPVTRRVRYACAGHPPPRLKGCRSEHVTAFEAVGNLPLGIIPEERYDEHVEELAPGDQIVLYTDGITELRNPSGEMFGMARLDDVLDDCRDDADDLIQAVLAAVERFASGRPADDDLTLLVAKVR